MRAVDIGNFRSASPNRATKVTTRTTLDKMKWHIELSRNVPTKGPKPETARCQFLEDIPMTIIAGKKLRGNKKQPKGSFYRCCRGWGEGGMEQNKSSTKVKKKR